LLNDVFVRRGRYVAPGAADEVLVGESFALAHGLVPGDTFGAVINGRWQRLRIVGIANSPEFVYVIGGAGIFPDDRRYGVMWMGHKTMEAAFDMEGAFNSITLRLAPGADEREEIGHVDRLLDRYGNPGAYGRDDQISHQMLDGEIKQDKVTGIVVPAIFLAVAALLIHNVLMRIIALQRAQIGVLKAFGYRHGEIAAHYLQLGLATVLCGCLIGIGLGTWLGHGLALMYQRFFYFPVLAFRLSPWKVGSVLLVCGLATALGALPALRRALALPPAEAMRAERPPTFRPLLLEGLGYARLLTPAARMLLRNLERRPVRVAASVIAVALSCALLVVGRFGVDAIDETVRVQFRDARRDDVRVAFYEARAPRVRHDLAQLPGVTHVEGIRVTGARVRHEHRTKRVVVFGLPQHGELQRILDVRHNEVPLPPRGAVLSLSLAELLRLRPGDTVTVEFLEGKRLARQVPVAATVEEAIGLYVYLEEHELARLMGESVGYTDVYLRIDADRLQALYDRLKRLPVVAGVTLREATIRSFLDTIAENLLITVTILILFAGAIAAGVVYNGARISLSEHAVTLASLRVLGFTRGEVSTILLGEQALLTAVGIPLGLLVGYGLCAWLSHLLETELYRLPLALSTQTYLYAAGSVALAATASGLAVAWRVRHLDLVAVLKTRE
jgi:putative ABC transport system permease protein